MRFVFAVAVEVEDAGIVDFGGVIHDTGQLVAVMEYAQVVYLADMSVLLPATALQMLDITVGVIFLYGLVIIVLAFLMAVCLGILGVCKAVALVIAEPVTTFC